jgi:hypothetical protein
VRFRHGLVLGIGLGALLTTPLATVLARLLVGQSVRELLLE